jgi:hypothetical protein
MAEQDLAGKILIIGWFIIIILIIIKEIYGRYKKPKKQS